MLKIAIIVGARPQFIKLAPLQLALKSLPVQEILIHTGQHYDTNMSEVFFRTLKLHQPHYILNHGGKSHGDMTGAILRDVEEILLQNKPDFTLVFGDTNSTLAAALASIKLQIPIIHIEAGLRSFDHKMPEEINRILTDRISKILCCPTQNAIQNLINEGFNSFDCIIKNTGDIMKDSSLLFEKFAKKPPLQLQKKFTICTIHRQENLNKNALENIFQALEIIAQNTQVILPLHPSTKRYINPSDYKNITFSSPLSYLEMLYLLKNTQSVLTDSGGLQKEAYFFKKPCLVLRENSEWSELIMHKYNLLVGNKTHTILESFANISKLCNFSYTQNFYGNGDTSQKIIEILKEFL
ncbi:non-hydrolyzing UDP-N-acetylglucosamine 2-epimerase [Helicobacter anatolicus]|uniref:non-hydrolyzing UDP-N-acetylglucosamine 2-epimerase n=1 Tax=Helicobacter anatolicus TaxID=2905874 RepID=UPI001E411972|nr:UDP-N-acetylglucosamine 2-epimerase (non-hydrolyzing) [Helicobacter anatolicus]MCE3039556.1 UDP-N-acetylglucosamine 2-epimerase (non-hydrolyzing) [Helicobacter anatolicus]